MKQPEISTADQLNAALALQEIRRHSRLWDAARGRSGWREITGLICALLLLALGAFQLVRSGSFSTLMRIDGAYPLCMGLFLLALGIWGQMQRQLNALVEIVKHLEKERP